jgi:hypothetical protein
MVAGFVAVAVAGPDAMPAQQSDSQRASQPSQGRGGRPAGVAASLFTLLDANEDASLTSDEMKVGFDAWYTQWDRSKGNALTLEQILGSLAAAVPPGPGGQT